MADKVDCLTGSLSALVYILLRLALDKQGLQRMCGSKTIMESKWVMPVSSPSTSPGGQFFWYIITAR
jgi:hypothetical protein